MAKVDFVSVETVSSWGRACEGSGMNVRPARMTVAALLLMLVAACATAVGSEGFDGTGDAGFGEGVPTVISPPIAEFTRTTVAQATIETVDKMIDKCRGPVSVVLGPTQPTLVAEHDYCGGSEWIPELELGEAASLSGPGIEEGLYVATEIKTVPRHSNATVADLPVTDVVLQTCISKTEMILVGLTKFATQDDDPRVFGR